MHRSQAPRTDDAMNNMMQCDWNLFQSLTSGSRVSGWSVHTATGPWVQVQQYNSVVFCWSIIVPFGSMFGARTESQFGRMPGTSVQPMFTVAPFEYWSAWWVPVTAASWRPCWSCPHLLSWQCHDPDLISLCDYPPVGCTICGACNWLHTVPIKRLWTCADVQSLRRAFGLYHKSASKSTYTAHLLVLDTSLLFQKMEVSDMYKWYRLSPSRANSAFMVANCQCRWCAESQAASVVHM